MKRRITFEVDDGVLFDTLREIGGDCSALGTRLVETMLAGESGVITAVGMAIYGIILVLSEPASHPQQAITAEGGA